MWAQSNLLGTILLVANYVDITGAIDAFASYIRESRRFMAITPRASKPAAPQLSVVMLGASGAVGTQALMRLVAEPARARVTALVRRPLHGVESESLTQHMLDVLNPASYRHLLPKHDCAICTLGVGESSKVSNAEFVKIDKDAALSFATACKGAGVRHFELLCAVGANAKSASFYLRVKGELEEALKALQFDRLSLFQPSMILTPTNRYGLSQALVLAAWPVVSHAMLGPLGKYRGIKVEDLGRAIANNVFTQGRGTEVLQWKDFVRLSAA